MADMVAALVQQALSHLSRNEIAPAEALIGRSLSARPFDANATQLMGLIRQKQGRLQEAEQLYRKSLSMKADQPNVHYNLGSLFHQQARFDDAAAAFSEAIRLKPNYAEAHLRLGQTYQLKSNFAAAEKSFREALRVQPNFILAKQFLGGVLADQGRGVEAEQILRQALASAPRDPRQMAALQHNLAVALKQQRRLPEALALFDAAEKIAPDAVLEFNRAHALEDMGRLDEAVEHYRRAIARDPLNMHAHQDLNHLLYRLGRDGEFLKSFDEAAARFPKVGAFPLLKGSFLFQAQRLDEAAKELERAAPLMTVGGAAHDMLGQIYVRQGRVADAVAAFERATKIEPRNAKFWAGLTDTHLQSNDPERARETAEHAMTLAPSDQGVLARWGLALRKLDDPREEELNDYENLVQIFDLPPPEGYESMEAFNRDLNAYLDPMHGDSREPLEQTLRKGTQTHDNLIGRGHDLVERLRKHIDDAVHAYIASMGEDEKHPLFRRRERTFRYTGSWSARLKDCGFHTNHVHPFGWISSCYYVALPDVVADEAGQQGWLKFGEPSIDIGLADPVRRAVQPVPGRLVLFPSYMWHGTVPFRSRQTRTTIAFDAVPAP